MRWFGKIERGEDWWGERGGFFSPQLRFCAILEKRHEARKACVRDTPITWLWKACLSESTWKKKKKRHIGWKTTWLFCNVIPSLSHFSVSLEYRLWCDGVMFRSWWAGWHEDSGPWRAEGWYQCWLKHGRKKTVLWVLDWQTEKEQWLHRRKNTCCLCPVWCRGLLCSNSWHQRPAGPHIAPNAHEWVLAGLSVCQTDSNIQDNPGTRTN